MSRKKAILIYVVPLILVILLVSSIFIALAPLIKSQLSNANYVG